MRSAQLPRHHPRVDSSRDARRLRRLLADLRGEKGRVMSEHIEGPVPARRLAAGERMSTGALARWARACASHPWRVVGTWVGLIALLVVLVATVGGSLRDEFEIPGSDTQKATDLIESEFTSEQG